MTGHLTCVMTAVFHLVSLREPWLKVGEVLSKLLRPNPWEDRYQSKGSRVDLMLVSQGDTILSGVLRLPVDFFFSCYIIGPLSLLGIVDPP